jgi:hypothetical protein
MRKILLLLCITFAFMLVSIACSESNQLNPITPTDTITSDLNLPISSDTGNSSLIGVYTAEFDLDGNTVQVIPDRSTAAHFNVTSFLPPPEIHINSYDPGTSIVDVDLKVTNEFGITGYDLRVIIFTDSIGHKLLNDDNWTGLYDIAGGLPINPFRAYNKTTGNRVFPGKTSSTENFRIFLPGGSPSVQLAIDASYPSNCDEPYMMNNFTQGTLYDTVGSSAQVSVDVFDWQSNITSVQMFCPAITGTSLVTFPNHAGNTWSYNLINSTGAAQGNYTAYLIATSSGQMLYDEVTITITHQTTGIQPVGDVSVIRINRGEGGVNYMRITSVDFDWDDSQGAVEYAIERTDGWQTSTWTVIGTSETSDYNFIPTGNDLDEDYRFRVIARAERGGNPATDADPSEEVFIFFMSDAGYTSQNTWNRVKEVQDSGLYFTPWWGGGDEWGPNGQGMEGIMGIGEQPNTNIWGITHTPQPVPDLAGMKEAYCDGYMFKGYNWDPPTLGWTIGTLTTPNPSGDTVCDYNPSNTIFDASYWAYNRANVQGQNDEFCETNQSGWAGQDNDTWVHIGYYLNDLLDPNRDYIAMGLANGDTPLSTGS